jgi:hypothetical protein
MDRTLQVHSPGHRTTVTAGRAEIGVLGVGPTRWFEVLNQLLGNPTVFWQPLLRIVGWFV